MASDSESVKGSASAAALELLSPASAVGSSWKLKSEVLPPLKPPLTSGLAGGGGVLVGIGASQEGKEAADGTVGVVSEEGVAQMEEKSPPVPTSTLSPAEDAGLGVAGGGGGGTPRKGLVVWVGGGGEGPGAMVVGLFPPTTLLPGGCCGSRMGDEPLKRLLLLVVVGGGGGGGAVEGGAAVVGAAWSVLVLARLPPPLAVADDPPPPPLLLLLLPVVAESGGKDDCAPQARGIRKGVSG